MVFEKSRKSDRGYTVLFGDRLLNEKNQLCAKSNYKRTRRVYTNCSEDRLETRLFNVKNFSL